jgi:hypothetical protein
MEQTLDALGEGILDELSDIVRAGHIRYSAYREADLIELDARAQAACTYCHMLAEADRRFINRQGVRLIDYNGNLKLWLFEPADVVIRLKKMDEDGRSRNYPTQRRRTTTRNVNCLACHCRQSG